MYGRLIQIVDCNIKWTKNTILIELEDGFYQPRKSKVDVGERPLFDETRVAKFDMADVKLSYSFKTLSRFEQLT
jgi:hypothetical protein